MAQREHLEAFLQHEEHLRMLAKNGEDGFMKEFMALKQQSMRYKMEKTYSTTEGERDLNIRKNRYKDILPFDYTRIVLPETDDAEGSDYINANYITGIDGKNVYVAAQGPLPHTVNDFWRLLWETGVEIVIMACNEYESGKHKCEKYWADENETKQFGSVTVTLIRQLRVTPDFMIRTLKANNQAEERVINQFHYTAWPDHGVPKTIQPIMEMIQLFREYLPNDESLVVMHCSAGCGRTGTMICIDYVRALLKAGKVGADFCLYDIIMEMRRQRPAIVQTRDQYELVHRAVAWLFRKELGIAPNPNDYDHLYENVKLQNEGPRMPPGAGNLSPDTWTTPQFKTSPKQRRHKDKEHVFGHNYVNHSIHGKGTPSEDGISPPAAKVLKPPSLPIKQQHDAESSGTIYANVQEKGDVEEKTTEDTILSPPFTPKHSPSAQERFESGYKSTLAAFKEFEMPPTQARPASPKPTEPVKPTLRLKPVLPASESRTITSSRSFDLDLAKPVPPAKPPLSDKPAIGDKPVKRLPSPRPGVPLKPAVTRKKESGGGGSPRGKGQSSGLKRRPTSEPVKHSQDQGKVQHLGTAQFRLAKNLVQAKLINKPEGDSSKEVEVKKIKERRDSKGRPTSAPPKPPTTVVKPTNKPSAGKNQPYEEVAIAPPPGKDGTSIDKQEASRGFQYQIQPVATVKLQSHKDKVDAKAPNKIESPSNQMQHRKIVDLSRPQPPAPKDNSEEYSYALQPVSVIEKLKDAQSRPQLRTGKGLDYASPYADPTDDGNPKDTSKSPQSPNDSSYTSEVIIPVMPSNINGNLKRYSPNRSNCAESTAYEVIQVNGPPGRRSSDGTAQDDSSVFDKGPGQYNEPNFGSGRQMEPRESVISSTTSWASFTDDDYDYDDDDDMPPSLPVKTAGAYELVDGEDGDESGSGSSSKTKFAQFFTKASSGTKGFLKQFGTVGRTTPTPITTRSSPPSTLSSSPQATIVSDLNEIIKKTLREYEPTYKEEPNMYNNKYDISFPKRVPKPKSPPPPPNGWIKPDTHSTTAPVHL